MPRFRKKPIEIEAVQWFKPGDHAKVKMANKNVYDDSGVMLLVHIQQAFIQTLEGEMTVTPGDWIITGIKGEVYPIKDEIFKLTYEDADKDDKFVQAYNNVVVDFNESWKENCNTESNIPNDVLVVTNKLYERLNRKTEETK